MVDITQVYQWLEDKESKDIYASKISYNMTKNPEYIQRIIDDYIPEFQKEGVWTEEKAEVLFKALEQLPEDKVIIIYGAGLYGKEVFQALKDRKNLYFCDRNLKLQKDGLYGIKVIAPEQLATEYRNAFIIIASTSYDAEIYDYLLQQGFKDDNMFKIKKYVRQCLLEEQYFDTHIISFKESEVFVDCGCFDFFTEKTLLKKCKTVKKIYAFEPNEEQYAICRDISKQYVWDEIQVSLLPYGVFSQSGTLAFCKNGQRSSIVEKGDEAIRVVALDEIIEGEVTFIKMDIEGAEYEALMGAHDIIKKYKPKLAISVYHKDEDMINIPILIKSLNPEYKLYIRHYSNNKYETILYAV